MAKRHWTTVEKHKFVTTIVDEKGNCKKLFTPSGKCANYGAELAKGVHNVGKKKGKSLTDCEAGYRMGYRVALAEQAKIYNKKNGKY